MSQQQSLRNDDRRTDTATTPFAPHTESEVEEMLASIGANSLEELFDIPESVRFDDSLDIEPSSEREVVNDVRSTLERNGDATEFLGRGCHSHYVPAIVDYLSIRSEFLTSYTQYQPETSQGFLQALFEYQSMLVELTGLAVANCSMYDAATALGEAATLADRVRDTSGDTILLSNMVREEKRSVLENYADGAGLTIETIPSREGNLEPATLADYIDEDSVMVYAESPTSCGTIQEHLATLGTIANENDALFCLGTDPVALALLEEPASVGADVVVGDASVLGLPASYGMGLGLFAVSEEYLRQSPGRLVGVSEDREGSRAFTLTLQTREQHIRKERATSNICTNQAWVALRAAIHMASLGASGLRELANECVNRAEEAASRLDDIAGIEAPVYDRHHFRDIVVRTERSATEVTNELADRGYLVHSLDDQRIQVSLTETNENQVDELIAAFKEVI